MKLVRTPSIALEDTLRDLRSMFNNAKDLKAVLTKFVEENDSIKKELESFRAQAVSRAAKNMVEHAETVNGVQCRKNCAANRPSFCQGHRLQGT